MESKSQSSIRSWRKGRVGFIQLSRPEKANAYNQSILKELELSICTCESDEEVRVIIICSTGEKTFCAGADLDEMGMADPRSAIDLASAKVFGMIAACSTITLASINGVAAGGGLELALACDLRICVDHATFFFPETKLGLMPAAGATQRLPGIVGVGHAKELILGGKVWTAQDALRFGLVSDVFTDAELQSRAESWGHEISTRDPLAMRLAKQTLTLPTEHPAGYALERISEAFLYQQKRDVRAAARRETLE